MAAIQKIQIFNNEQFGTIRTAGTADNPMFCLADICRVLEIGNATDVKKRLKTPYLYTIEVGVATGKKADGTEAIQNVMMTFINESNLYRCIFQSRKPNAEAFQDWIFEEVIPSIRKTGSYGTPRTFAEALRLAADQQEEIERQQLIIEQQKPKVKYFNDLVDRNLNINFRDTAKEIGLKQNDFINRLLAAKYIYRDTKNQLKPYAAYVGSLFIIKECKSGDKWAGNQTLVTPKGRETFNLLFSNK